MRKGKFTVLRKTMRKKWQAKLKEVRSSFGDACMILSQSKERACERLSWDTGSIMVFR
jgi:hypothetical protein